jgi:hypothetical protein
MFITRLTEASKEKPDFAGHYVFAGWGCGSACAAGAIVDLATGRVYAPPFGGKSACWPHWIFCGGPIDKPYTEYRRDSRLLILNCTVNAANQYDTFYFIWENEQFRQILHIPGPKEPTIPQN